MPEPRCLRSSQIALTIAALLTVGVSFTACSEQPQGGSSTRPQGEQLNQASAFKGEVYRSQDGRVVVTMTSSDELELAKNGVNLICKYTRQATAIRAVETVMGTSQAVYYRIIPEGIQGPDGPILYSPTALRMVTEQTELANRRAAEQARVRAEEQAKEQQRVAAHQEAIRIAEHARVERGIPGEWEHQPGERITITLEGGRFSGVYLFGNVRRVMRGGLLLDNTLALTTVSVTDSSRAIEESSKWTLILSADGASLTAEFNVEGLGGRIGQWKRVR